MSENFKKSRYLGVDILVGQKNAWALANEFHFHLIDRAGRNGGILGLYCMLYTGKRVTTYEIFESDKACKSFLHRDDLSWGRHQSTDKCWAVLRVQSSKELVFSPLVSELNDNPPTSQR